MEQTFAFYRILGNDLPPRHGKGQTLDCLRFILDHEPAFAGCEKRWILNRIADAGREAEIVALLDERKQVYRRIPFDLAKYAGCFLDADGLPPAFNTMSIAEGNTRQHADVLAYEWIYRRKNLYAINLNAARNLAIADGIASGAGWIMPWDGQCFLTADGFIAIRSAAEANPEARYLLTPLHRVAENQVVLQPGFRRGTEDEPQVTFRRDARDRFDELLRYGRGNKAEFLDRISSPRQWYKPTDWEPVRYAGAEDRGRLAIAGAVIRLSAAVTERTDAKHNAGRWVSRFAGVATHCAELDIRLVGDARARSLLLCYAPHIAPLSASRVTVAAIARAANHLSAAAAPRDLQGAMAAATTFAVASAATGNAAYANRAVAIIRDWLVGPNRPADAAKALTVVDMRDVWAFADALRMLERTGRLAAEDIAAVKGWFRALRDQMVRGDNAVSARDHLGIFHDLLLAGVAAYCDDVRLLAATLTRAALRVHRQVQPWGWQAAEGAGLEPLHRALFGLQGLIALAWLGRNSGIDLWRYAGANHRSIPMAARFIAQNRALFSDYAIGRARFDARIEMALRAIPADAADVEVISGLPRHAVAKPAQLGATDGLAPLWPILLATEAENEPTDQALELPVA